MRGFRCSRHADRDPITTRCVETNLGVPARVSSFVLPLGATVNMDGTALYEAIAAVFVATIYGIELSLGTQLVIVFVAMATAIGAPGIPSAGMVTMVAVLQAVGLPVEAVAILITIDQGRRARAGRERDGHRLADAAKQLQRSATSRATSGSVTAACTKVPVITTSTKATSCRSDRGSRSSRSDFPATPRCPGVRCG